MIKNPVKDRVGPEAYLERADVRSMQGDLAGAIADATVVLNSIGWKPSINATNTAVSTQLLGPLEWSDLAREALLARGEFYRRMGDLNKAGADLTWVIDHDSMARLIRGGNTKSQAVRVTWLGLWLPWERMTAAKQDLATCREDNPEYFESKIKPELTRLVNSKKAKAVR